MSDSSKLLLALLAVGGIFGFIYFISRPNIATQPMSGQTRRALVRPVRQAEVAREYLNTETWDIKYDADGLPTRVVISRKATEK